MACSSVGCLCEMNSTHFGFIKLALVYVCVYINILNYIIATLRFKALSFYSHRKCSFVAAIFLHSVLSCVNWNNKFYLIISTCTPHCVNGIYRPKLLIIFELMLILVKMFRVCVCVYVACNQWNRFKKCFAKMIVLHQFLKRLPEW